MTGIRLQALLIGDVRPLGPRGIPSGIAKRSVDQPIALGPLGLAGDAQGDTKHHGGPEKALHHYPLDHYPDWEAEIGHRDVFGTAGAFGENLSTLGVDLHFNLGLWHSARESYTPIETQGRGVSIGV